jgi:ZIP family zinc transporter
MVLGIGIAGGEGVSVGLLVAIFVSNLPEAIGASATSGDFQAAIDGFAAGALLVMLIDSMIPEASRNAGDQAGLVTVLGFAVAAALSAVT